MSRERGFAMTEGDLFCVKTLFSDQTSAEKVATLLVDAGLAVCARVECPVTSLHRLDGSLKKESEIPVTFNVLPLRLDLFLGELKLQHPLPSPPITGWALPLVDKNYLEKIMGTVS
jgi:uncharacterized protein involved in tolerance to divalent cations